jgi:hypothetical protein
LDKWFRKSKVVRFFNVTYLVNDSFYRFKNSFLNKYRCDETILLFLYNFSGIYYQIFLIPKAMPGYLVKINVKSSEFVPIFLLTLSLQITFLSAINQICSSNSNCPLNSVCASNSYCVCDSGFINYSCDI